MKLFILETYHALACANHHEIGKVLRYVLQIGAAKMRPKPPHTSLHLLLLTHSHYQKPSTKGTLQTAPFSPQFIGISSMEVAAHLKLITLEPMVFECSACGERFEANPSSSDLVTQFLNHVHEWHAPERVSLG